MFVREIVSMITNGINPDKTGRVIMIGGILLGAYILRALLRFTYGYYGHKAASDCRKRGKINFKTSYFAARIKKDVKK